MAVFWKANLVWFVPEFGWQLNSNQTTSTKPPLWLSSLSYYHFARLIISPFPSITLIPTWAFWKHRGAIRETSGSEAASLVGARWIHFSSSAQLSLSSNLGCWKWIRRVASNSASTHRLLSWGWVKRRQNDNRKTYLIMELFVGTCDACAVTNKHSRGLNTASTRICFAHDSAICFVVVVPNRKRPTQRRTKGESGPERRRKVEVRWWLLLSLLLWLQNLSL